MDYPIQSPGQLSSHLRALRKTRGLSQQQLGAMLGVGQTRIARIERDPTSIRADQLLAILSALGVDVVLRPKAAGGATPAGATGSTSARKAPARSDRAAKGGKGRAAADEPW